MDMDDLIICDKCECEFESHESMPNPETDSGDYCFKCHLDMEHDWNLKRGIAFLECELPSMAAFMKGFKKFVKGSLDPRSLENNCHAAATTLVKLVNGKLAIKLQRGHWMGTDVRNNNRTMQQHSWTKVQIPDNDIEFIIDPTQWVFTGADPSLSIVDANDNRYDVGGYATKQLLYGKMIYFPDRKGKLTETKFSNSTKKWLSTKADRDWSLWSNDEMFSLANMDPRTMDGHQKEIFNTIVKQGKKAFIPLEGLAIASGKM